jgi:natural product biosynthesis luciferase-like monooxygenase protein
MKFTIMFFSSDGGTNDPYRLMLDAARFADAHGFTAVWTPERHFDRFGGAFANPAITSAALASVTTRVQLRSGSLIAPLHDVVRIAEEWAMVDQLSRGRVALSFGSGWNANDFAFFPERYARRHAVMYEQIDQLRRIWREHRIERETPAGLKELELFPKPIQRELPVWLTTSGSPATYEKAGGLGANVLTHMIMQDTTQLRDRITAYRTARRHAGFDPSAGIVSLMLHTFLGKSDAEVRRIVKPSFREYLRSAVALELQAAQAGGVMSGGLSLAKDDIPPDVMEDLLDLTFERYYRSGSCMGTVDVAHAFVRKLEAIGVDEIACLVDFGVEFDAVIDSLKYLVDLKQRWETGAHPAAEWRPA